MTVACVCVCVCVCVHPHDTQVAGRAEHMQPCVNVRVAAGDCQGVRDG